MRIIEIIEKKRDGGELSTEEIQFFIDGFTSGDIPDYQASAWAMAVLLNGMTAKETTDLTLAMAHSGDTIDLSGVAKNTIDKHSTGGVGDKTTLVVQPVIAACGLPIGKMSGHALGFSGGTLDKMDSIPGFRTDLSIDEFLAQMKDIGLVLTGQTGDMTPADGKLYALRDVTGTVPSPPLIASSVMSKKLAGGASMIMLDIKTGMGAFMETLEGARELGKLMVKIAEMSGRKATAMISDMNQPLGAAVGNALELKEAIDTLHGGGPQDFRQHVLELAANMLVMAGEAQDVDAGLKRAEEVLTNEQAWGKFRQMVQAQGGDVSYIDQPEKLPQASLVETTNAPQSGYIAQINAHMVAEASVELGAGRAKKGDPIDYAVGVVVHTNVGDKVEKGQPLFTIHANKQELLACAREKTLAAHQISAEKVEPLPLFYGVIK